MFRSILGITTAISLTLPMAAFGQSDARETVRQVLETYGYDVAQMEMLSASQVAEIYLVATSEESSDVRELLSSMDLASHSMMGSPEVSDMVTSRVQAELAEAGYDPSVIQFMSQGEIVQIYVAATSESMPDIEESFASMNLPRAGEERVEIEFNAESDIRNLVSNQLMSMGYTEAQINSLSQNDIAEIYIELTGEDMDAVRTAVEGALES